MPPRASKRKAKTTANEDDDAWRSSGGLPRKRARLSASHVDEDAEEPRNDPRKGKHGTSWAEWQTKFNDKEKSDRAQFAQVFMKNAEKTHEDIHKLLSKSKGDVDVASKKHAELFREACTDIQPHVKHNSKSKMGETVQEHPLFKTGQTLVRICRDLVTAHEQGNEASAMRETDQMTQMRAQFEKDKSGVEKALTYSAQYAEKFIARSVDLCGSAERRSVAPPRGELNEPANLALDMHQRSTRNLLSESSTWGEEAIAYLEKLLELAAMTEKTTD